MKYCTKCKSYKNDTEFAKDRSNKIDGLQTNCKECKNKYLRQKRDREDPGIATRRRAREIRNEQELTRLEAKRERKEQIRQEKELKSKLESDKIKSALISKSVTLKCTHCGTMDQTKFTTSKLSRANLHVRPTKKDIQAGIIIRLNWCRECQREKDSKKRQERNLEFDPKIVLTCPKCSTSGDYESGVFRKGQYRHSVNNVRKKTPSILCRTCGKNSPKSRLTRNIRGRLKACLYEAQGKTRSTIQKRIGTKSEEIVGCTLEELRQHIESQFTEGMSWDNYGEWHLDHIKPLSSFNIVDEEKLCINIDEAKKANHYTNLQPLWAADNMKKSNRK